jgi:predicted RNA binding protein YcfA (HicA-like mRNA interferase family)
MARTDPPKRLSQKSAIKLLQEDGWTMSRGGKHVVKMVKPGQRPITLPMHKGAEYSAGLTRSILKAAGLD